MKATSNYPDFSGTAAADISDFISKNHGESVLGIAKYFKINLERFKPIGLIISGSGDPSLSILCVDLKRSTDEKEFIVKIMVEHEGNLLDILFKGFEVVLYKDTEKKYNHFGNADLEICYDDIDI